jgi:ABC-type iron transport system FetAB ATPase subunit
MPDDTVIAIDVCCVHQCYSFTVAPGERLLIEGASGAGRSSLLRYVTRHTLLTLPFSCLVRGMCLESLHSAALLLMQQSRSCSALRTVLSCLTTV